MNCNTCLGSYDRCSMLGSLSKPDPDNANGSRKMWRQCIRVHCYPRLSKGDDDEDVVEVEWKFSYM